MAYYDDVFDSDERNLMSRGAASGWMGAAGMLARSIQ